MKKANPTNNGKIKITNFEWFVPHYTSSFSQQAILSKQFLSKVPTELQYVGRYVFMKKKKTRNSNDFELGTQECINFPIWTIVGFQERDRQHSQNLNNDSYYRPPVTSDQCIIGTEKYPDSAILIIYDDDDY